jgi:hypothetical protein
MSSSSDFELIHGQLHVCDQVNNQPLTPEALGRGPCSIRGAAYFQSPTILGNDKTFEATEATVMIGPLKNLDAPFPIVCGNLEFIDKWEISPCSNVGVGKGMEKGKELLNPYSLVVRKGRPIVEGPECCAPKCEGPRKGPAAAMFIGDVDFYENVRIKEKLSVVDKADFYDDIVVRQNVITGKNGCFGGTLDGTPTGRLLARIEVADARPKPFDMVHPSLGKGHRLRYACIEGPEVGVYFRGRVTNKTEIELPWYWKDLVHTRSISVQLQPIGSHQDIIVKRWDAQKIYLQSKSGVPIDCFYHVYAERKDVNALVVEYDGNEWSDYPDKDYNDPQYANKVNTKTL